MPNIDQQQYDENGDWHDEWLEYYSNGKIKHRSNWVHGIRHGLWERYYDDGSLRYRGYWNMGRKIGYWNWYNYKRYYLWLM